MSRQPSEGLAAYRDIAEELSGSESAREVLAMLDPETVRLAKEYAKRTKKRWPPRPQTSGWTFQIISLEGRWTSEELPRRSSSVCCAPSAPL